jgi:hypothetical protein
MRRRANKNRSLKSRVGDRIVCDICLLCQFVKIKARMSLIWITNPNLSRPSRVLKDNLPRLLRKGPATYL